MERIALKRPRHERNRHLKPEISELVKLLAKIAVEEYLEEREKEKNASEN